MTQREAVQFVAAFFFGLHGSLAEFRAGFFRYQFIGLVVVLLNKFAYARSHAYLPAPKQTEIMAYQDREVAHRRGLSLREDLQELRQITTDSGLRGLQGHVGHHGSAGLSAWFGAVVFGSQQFREGEASPDA